MKRVRDGEFGTRKEEPKNPKSKNLSSEISLAGKGYSKVGLDTLKLSRSFFSLFSFLSFFLSFFRLGRTPLQRERWSMMPWTRTKEERRLLERQEREPRVILLLKEKSR